MRQLVAGVDTFEMRPAVDVITAIHQPVDIEHHNRIDAKFARALADDAMPSIAASRQP